MKGSGRTSDRGSSVIGGHRGGQGAGRRRGRGRITKTPVVGTVKREPLTGLTILQYEVGTISHLFDWRRAFKPYM